jgi:hypothetical protein
MGGFIGAVIEALGVSVTERTSKWYVWLVLIVTVV